MKFGIIITTYYRPDGRTKNFLTRALTCVRNQIHQDYKVYLIGDKYQDDTEFLEIAQSIIDPDKIYFENLTLAKERDQYLGGEKLWCSGGVSARNYGIEKCISDGFEYVCNLDHDDIWSPEHLSSINNILITNPQYNFILSKCNYRNLYIVPLYSRPGDFYPQEGDTIHSATCLNFKLIPLRYRDVFAETGQVYPSDADLWNRVSQFLKSQNQTGFLLDKVTVMLDKEERK